MGSGPLSSPAISTPAGSDAAVQAACAAIARAFGAGAIAARHRQAARIALRRLSSGPVGPVLHDLAARYGDLAMILPQDFTAALRAVETRLVQERALHRRHAAGAWYLRPSRARLAILAEARLILRWLRRHRRTAQFGPALEAITAPAWSRIAAE